MVQQSMARQDYTNYDTHQPFYQHYQIPPQQWSQLISPNVDAQEVYQMPSNLNLSNSAIPSKNLSNSAIPSNRVYFGKSLSLEGYRNSVLAGGSSIGISDPYRCYLLEQIQGSYVVDSAISILVTLIRRGDQKYCIVKQE